MNLFFATTSLAVLWSFCVPDEIAAAAMFPPGSSLPLQPLALPSSQLGANMSADYEAFGHTVSAEGDGARLRSTFQSLEAEATTQGLWLVSTVTGQSQICSARFRVVATAIGRESPLNAMAAPCHLERTNIPAAALPAIGSVAVTGKLARFLRPGLVEEYSTSINGIRQDFLVTERPQGAGELQVQLGVAGAEVEPSVAGAVLLLTNSGRRLAYSRLRATDAAGHELPVRMEVEKASAASVEASGSALLLRLDDAGAIYPLRIDPTFSDANWASMGGSPGASDTIYATAVDGSGNLYIGGAFRGAGDALVNYIAKWDGKTWSALGAGMNSFVQALAVSGNDVYAGGSFTTAGGVPAKNIARWNGTNWNSLGSGMDSYVAALMVWGGELYAGGAFTTAGGISANRIAKWDGNAWVPMGSGMNGNLYALMVSGADMYAGGDFTSSGGASANHIARWDGNSWSPVGAGMNGAVHALVMSGNDLYAGGLFTEAGGSPANYVAKWNGMTWTALASGVTEGPGFNGVYTLAAGGGDIYAGGPFTKAGGSSANYIAKWDGANWSSLGSGMEYLVNALVAVGGDLYAGGAFRTAGGIEVSRIAKWNGAIWSELGFGLNGPVAALAAVGTNVYAGGSFTRAGESPAAYIATRQGRTWKPLGSGMNSNVLALAVSTSHRDLYAGGDFTRAGGTEASHIAKWDGANWLSLASGCADSVWTIAVSGTDVYAAGAFTNAGGSPANYIAKWNGSSWSALGLGMNGFVRTLAVSGSELYAGGDFTRAGGIAASQIAKWNGSNWSSLDSQMDGFVLALAVSGTDLYAGGGFTSAGGKTAFRIAKWNGNTWSGLGGIGLDYPPRALAVSDGELYAGGFFTRIRGSIAKWNGVDWSPLGSGMDREVLALAISGNDLYAGGLFTTAGAKPSAHVAHAYLDLPKLSIIPTGPDVTLSWPGTLGLFDLQQSSNPANPSSWLPANSPVTTNSAIKRATVATKLTNQFFRLIGN